MLGRLSTADAASDVKEYPTTLPTILPDSQLAGLPRGIILARAHNDLQPVSRLPVELVLRIFDYIVKTDHWLPANIPYILSVFHYWRVVGVFNTALWSKITIRSFPALRKPAPFRVFDLPQSPTSLRRLERHLDLSQNAPLTITILINDYPLLPVNQDLRTAVELLYKHAWRFQSLFVSIPAESRDAVLPLPRNLSNLESLTVDSKQTSLYGVNLPSVMWLQESCDLQPIKLELLGTKLLPSFASINPRRLTDLAVHGFRSHTQHLRDFRDFVHNARNIQRLSVDLGPLEDHGWQADTEAPHDAPLTIPLEGLDIWSDPAPLLRILDMSRIAHLDVSRNHMREELDSPPFSATSFNAAMKQCNTLQSLSFLDWEWDENDPVHSWDVDSWFLGKYRLVAVGVPVNAVVLASARSFTPATLPALRYLAIDNGSGMDADEGEDVDVLGKIAAIMAASSTLQIMLFGFPLQKVRILSGMMGKERAARLAISKRWFSSMEKFVREHEKGVQDCLEWYRQDIDKLLESEV